MGTIIEFPASRRQGRPAESVSLEQGGTVVILPVIRIERQIEDTSGGRGPQEGTAAGRRRRRR
jgi:hypothetical protein